MKKTFLALAGVLFCSVFAFSQEMKGSIDTEYLSGEENASYTEWTGGYSPSEINTRAQIKDIGRRLANGIIYQETEQQDPFPFNKGNPAYKYSAARVYGGTKRGADVILIGETATVDTIKCLKMILQGYVENAYGISAGESEAVAQALCNWNTALYKNRSLLNEFEDGVKNAFSGYSSKTGLSTSYRDWKKSVLVIPHLFTQVQVEAEETAYEEPQYEYQAEPEPAPVEEYVPETKTETKPEYNSYNSSKSNNKYGQNTKNVKNPKKNNNKKLIIIAAACGGAVALAAIIILMMMRKKDDI